jgi:hypothetical protein
MPEPGEARAPNARRSMAREALMATTSGAVVETLLESFAQAKRNAAPYPHWFLTRCLPQAVADEITVLPFPAPELGGISGKREVHNATRKYFDAENKAKYAACNSFCEAFQDKRVTGAIEKTFGTKLSGSYLRVEYAQDIDGFWLEPHTDLGVKVFPMLLYLSKDASHADLGTDIYDTNKTPIGRSPFEPNGAMIFVPSGITYHGFEGRRIEGVRKSVIVNYVTNEWRAREQLSFPDRPIS